MAKRSRKTEPDDVPESGPELAVEVKLDELRAGLVRLAERLDVLERPLVGDLADLTRRVAALESAETARRELARKLGK